MQEIMASKVCASLLIVASAASLLVLSPTRAIKQPPSSSAKITLTHAAEVNKPDTRIPYENLPPNSTASKSKYLKSNPEIAIGDERKAEIPSAEASRLSAAQGHPKRAGRNFMSRSRRSLIIPGTNWCGVGNIAGSDSEVGSHVGADRCCREHDQCPHTIEGFTTKYNLYNFRFHTISHCECDDVFRTCLLSANSDQADHIGDLFFNVLGLKCFAFRRDMVCAERSWWGRCVRERPQVSAETRDPLVYVTTS